MKKNVTILLTLVIVGMILAWPISYFFSKIEKQPLNEQLLELDKLAQEALVDTEKGNLEEARTKISKLAQLFPKQTLPVSIRIESLNSVTQSILDAKKIFHSAKPDEDRLLWHATQVRIAVDALHHTHQPMWREYYAAYFKQMQNMLKSSVERDESSLREQFEQNYQLYLVIRPAMSVQVKEADMERIAGSYELIMKGIRSETIEWQDMREALRELSGVMQEAFVGEDKSAIVLFMGPDSPMTLIGTVAAVVTMTLAYVAWKKYAGQQHAS